MFWLRVFIFMVAIGCVLVVAFPIFRMYQQKSLESRKAQAAQRSIEWILQHKDDVSAYDAVWLLGDLYNVVPDNETAQKILTAIQEIGATIQSKTETNEITERIGPEKENLTPVLLDLLRRKCLGEDINTETKKITQELEKMEPSQDLGQLYMLKELGIGDQNHYNQLVSEFVSVIKKQPNQANPNHLDELLSFITHIVLYQSDYFSQYPDPNMLRQELSILKRSLTGISTSPTVLRNNVDLLAQILFSLKLLRQKPDDTVNALYNGLIAIQNNDGSWSETQSKEFTFHNTVMATIALMNFPDKLRGRKVFCTDY